MEHIELAKGLLQQLSDVLLGAACLVYIVSKACEVTQKTSGAAYRRTLGRRKARKADEARLKEINESERAAQQRRLEWH